MGAGRPCTDHLGNVYGSMEKMAAHYGISGSTLRDRLKHGCALKDALTSEPFGIHKVQDHTGRVFRTQEDMCAAWNTSVDRLSRNLKAGMTLEQALTESPSRGRYSERIRTDHLGNTWPSNTAMCRAYGVDIRKFQSNIEKGMSVEEALSVKIQKYPTHKDWAGRVYKTRSAMAKKLHVNPNSILYWTKTNGKYADPENAARNACMKCWPGTMAGQYLIRACIEFPWFLCEDTSDPTDAPHAGELMLHAEKILELKNAS